MFLRPLLEIDYPRADLDRRLGALAGGDDCLGVAVAESAEDEEAGDARLARASCHNLESLGVALQGQAVEVVIIEGYPAPPQDDLAGDDAPAGEPHPLKHLLPEQFVGSSL